MRKLLLISVFVFFGVHTASSQIENICNEDCLRGLLDETLEAMVSKNRTQLPLAENVKYTENGQTLEIGDGMWGPASAVRNYKQYFFDEDSQEAGIFSVVEENGHPQIIALRLNWSKVK